MLALPLQRKTRTVTKLSMSQLAVQEAVRDLGPIGPIVTNRAQKAQRALLKKVQAVATKDPAEATKAVADKLRNLKFGGIL